MRRHHAILATGLLLLAARASGQVFPARSGDTGILDVVDGETLGSRYALFGAEMGATDQPGQDLQVAPLPLYAVSGIGRALNLGLSMRGWSQPDDPRSSSVLFGGTAKLRLLEGTPKLALAATWDRFNDGAVAGLRLASSRAFGRLRAAANLGVESEAGSFGGFGVAGGAAVSFGFTPATDVAAQFLTGPRGAKIGAAVRHRLTPVVAIGLGLDYLPGDEALRTSFFLSFASVPKTRPEAVATAKPSEAAPQAEEAAVALLDDRPHFRLRIGLGGPESVSGPRHRQHGVRAAVAEELPAGPRAVLQAAAAGPSAEDVFESQLRDQEASADARERRLKSTEDSLLQREAAATAEAQQLEARDQQLSAREIQLDAREKRIVLRGPPTPTERAIESQEAQLGAQERQLAAQERGFQPTLDTATGRERDASARAQLERADAERLGDEWKRARDRVAQLDTRRQALSARQRLLAATEARLLAMGERIDASERQTRTRAERIDAWNRRLDARAERLELLERRSGETRKAPDARAPEAAPTGAAAAAPREKAVFVMVVKAPTAIMKEGAAAAPAGGPAAPASAAAVEKAVAAATVVSFPTPQSELSELDRESIENIAKLAAREGAELLVWARAKSPALMAEAQRRADSIKKLATTAAQLEPRRVVTRVTTRPGAVGVDVVVSALRDAAKAPGPAAPAGAPAGQAPIQMLGSGETGKRQIRDAVLRAQPAIESCVGDQIQRKLLARAEGVLKLTVAANGKVVIVKTSEGDLAGPEMEGCLTQAARTWQFPAAEGEYVVDVPITVIGGGAAK